MSRSLGVCYYPEHWPEDQWSDDARRMAEAGLSWVRIGEFAWSRIEPSPGQLEFEWLERAITVLSDHGLRVVLGTPTATPPRWMVSKHPDMLAVDENGNTRKFGSRRHYCFSHAGYIDECRRIVDILAQRYGHDPRIHAWQIDNEYGCHDTTLSYSDSARDGFRMWLAKRYTTVSELNRAWGNVFWSMEYSDFSDIDLPSHTVTEPNPAHVLAFRRFSSDQVVEFNRAQVDILRTYTDAPLIHNYMGRILDFDHFRLGADLDIASWDSYPIGFLSERLEASPEHKSLYLRQGDPDFQAFHHDLYRSVGRGRWWVMEQQPGPVNWAPHNPAPLPGMARLWAWEAFAHGAETVCYFRWRQAPFGQEQMHAGLVRPDNDDAPAMSEVRQVAHEIKEAGEDDTETAAVALVFDYPSAWAWQVQPHGADFDYFRLVFEAYQAVRCKGLNIDIVPHSITDYSKYGLVLAPGLSTIPGPLKEAIQASDAIWLVGPRSNAKTDEMSIPTPLPPALPGLDCRVQFVESLPPTVSVPINGGGAFRHWFEHLEGEADAAETTEAGMPAVMASGNVRYIAGWPDTDFWDHLISSACKEARIEIVDLPGGLRLRATANRQFAFNYASEKVEWSGQTIPPAGVAWWPLSG